MILMLPNALSWLRSILFTIPLIIISTIFAGISVLLAPLLGGRGDFQDRCMRAWARMLLAVSFVRVSTSGLEKLDGSQAYLFCSNHLSYMDPPIILASLGNRVRFVAKKSLFAIPIFGWAMRAAGHIAIDRGNPRAAARSLAKAADELRAGMSVIIFPEGGRSLDGEFQAFLSGAFRLAIKVHAPVVPIAVVGSRKIFKPGSINIHSGPVQMMVGEPVQTRGMSAKDRDALAARIRGSILEMLAEKKC